MHQEEPVGPNRPTPEVWDIASWSMLSRWEDHIVPMTLAFASDDTIHALFNTVVARNTGFTLNHASHSDGAVSSTTLPYPDPAVVRALALDPDGRPSVLYGQDGELRLRRGDTTEIIISELGDNRSRDWEIAHGRRGTTYIRVNQSVYTHAPDGTGALAVFPDVRIEGCGSDRIGTGGPVCERRASDVTRPVAFLGGSEAAWTVQSQHAECGTLTWRSTPDASYPGVWGGELNSEDRLLLARFTGNRISMAAVAEVDVAGREYKIDAALDRAGGIHIVLGSADNSCDIEVVKISCGSEDSVSAVSQSDAGTNAPKQTGADGVVCGDSHCSDSPCCVCSTGPYCDVQRSLCCSALVAYVACDGPEDCPGEGQGCCVGSGNLLGANGVTNCCDVSQELAPGESTACHEDSDCGDTRPNCCPALGQDGSPIFSVCEP